MNELLLLPLEQVLHRDPRTSRHDRRDILTRHPIPQARPSRTSLTLRSASIIPRDSVLQRWDDLVPQSRRRLKVVIPLRDLEVDLGSLELLLDVFEILEPGLLLDPNVLALLGGGLLLLKVLVDDAAALARECVGLVLEGLSLDLCTSRRPRRGLGQRLSSTTSKRHHSPPE